MAFPDWPSAWLEDHDVATSQALAAGEGVELVSALRGDGQVLFRVSWPEGRRWMLVDPVGGGVPSALRAGVRSPDGEAARIVEGLWSQALTLAKGLLDGDVELPGEQGASRKRRWRR